MTQNTFEVSDIFILRNPDGAFHCAFPNENRCWLYIASGDLEKFFELKRQGWTCENHKLALEVRR